MASSNVPTFDASGMPRLPAREATDASRGYVAGWAQAIDALLSGSETDEVYVEAFEDVTVVSATGDIGGIQVKDKKGAFSVTQAESCGMLERWAAVIEVKPKSWFRFCSTQVAGNLHDSSEAFIEWVAGGRSDHVLEELRVSLESFVNRRQKGKFPILEQKLQSVATFRPFWERITWQLGGAGLDALVERLLATMAKRYLGDVPQRLRERLFAWLGAVALSASSDDVKERCWNKARLDGLDPKTDLRLALLANLIARLIDDREREFATSLAEILGTVRLLANRLPKDRPSLKPSVFIHSPRLDAAATAVVEELARGTRLVALQGRPADGKSEVARQLASLLPGGYLVELPTSLEPRDAWRQSLLRVARGLGAEPGPDVTLDEFVELVRDLLAEEVEAVLVCDNVDAPPPFDLRLLLRHEARSKCVCVGGGLADPDRVVSLARPDERTFIEIAAEPYGSPDALSPRVLSLVREIGRLTDFSAICARAVGWDCDPGRLEEDLDGLRQAIEASGATSFEQRIEAAVRKCWSALDRLSQRRVRLIAALGEPELPLVWLPPALREGPPGPWRLLERSGTAPRGKDNAIETVRVHRLVASWADKELEVESVADLSLCLAGWVADPHQADDLKFAGPRLRALVSGLQVGLRHGLASIIAPETLAALRRAYMDACGHLGLEATALERAVRAGLEGTTTDSLPPVVLGQLLDAVPVRLAKHSRYLEELRNEVAGLLAAWVGHVQPPNAYTDDGLADTIDAYRHHAKELFRVKRKEDATNLLLRLDRVCAEGYARSRDRRLWNLLQTKGRIQLASRAGTTDGSFEALLLEVIDRPEGLPDYLRLAALRVLVKAFPLFPTSLLAVPRREPLIREGLTLCRRRRSLIIQGEFLLAAVTAIEMSGLQSLYPEVVRTADEMLSRSTPSDRSARWGISHALHRAGTLGTTPESHSYLIRALHVLLGDGKSLNDFQMVRACAILRDAWWPDLAEPVLSVIATRQLTTGDQDAFWSAFELAKTLRWRGHIKDVPALLRPFHEILRYTLGIDDELAKVAGMTSKTDEAREVLTRNAAAYEARHQPGFAAQCRRWAEGLPTSLWDRDGLLGDMTRSRLRYEALDEDQRRAVHEELTATAARLHLQASSRDVVTAKPGTKSPKVPLATATSTQPEDTQARNAGCLAAIFLILLGAGVVVVGLVLNR
jgi:hypothetical protein